MLFGGLLTISLALLVSNGNAIKWNQCGSPRGCGLCGKGNKDNIVVKNFDLSPMPMRLPGKVQASVSVVVLNPLNGSDVSITIRRKTFLGFIRVPCLFEVGSCTYKNSCTLLQRIASENWGGFLGPIVQQLLKAFEVVGAKIDCPVPRQEVTVNKIPLKLPKVPSYMKFFATGDYEFKMETKDRRNGKSILCLQWDLSLA